MRQNLPNIILFFLLLAAMTFGWWYVDQNFLPKPKPQEPETPRPARDLAGAVMGAVALGSAPLSGYPALAGPVPPTRAELQASILSGASVAQRLTASAKPAPAVRGTAELIPVGDETSFIRAFLNTRGGGIQQVTLARFAEANRLGLAVKTPSGQEQALRLIPGVNRPRDMSTLTAEAPFPVLVAGKVTDESVLAEPAYVVLHYPSEDDPARQAKDAGRMNDNHPSTELRDRTWDIAEQGRTPEGDWRVVFETTLEAPYFLKLRKTFTLAAAQYHLGFKFEIEPLPGRVKGKGRFRYQIVGPRNLPIEGEWYTYEYRNAVVGWRTPSGAAKRSIEDAATVFKQHGGEMIARGDNALIYAGIKTQYFASVIAVNDQSPGSALTPWEYVRATREPEPTDSVDFAFLADLTTRAVSRTLDPAPGERIEHQYLIYNGPAKVRLLSQLEGEWAVSPELVNRYLETLTLSTITDYHSPNFFGKFANAIWWSDVVIAFTNLMHSVLGQLNSWVPMWGLNIIMLTVLVRLLLMIPSRKQQAMMMRMQEKMAVLKPEIDKLQEKYKDDPQGLQQAKMQLMMRNGVNPLSTTGGCLLIFAQMPIFMGLYFCLQESVFFRHQSFLWFPNLAAPDMLVWWSEKIPFLSTPSNLGGIFYLGPYFNLLPLLAVALIFLQQYLTMPPPTDEQQEMQQKMMKIMVGAMAIFFYKVPAGLSLYFICSTTWALMERQLIPKPKVEPPKGVVPPGGSPPPQRGGKPGSPAPSEPEKPSGFLGRMKARMEEKMEEIKRQNEEQTKRQIRNQPPPPGGRDKKNRKKR